MPRSAIGGGAEFIAKGEVEIGLYLLSEVLTTKGTAVAGMLPAALQNHVVYTGAILSDSRLARRRGGVHQVRRRSVEAGAVEGDGIREHRQGELSNPTFELRNPAPLAAVSAVAISPRPT